MSKDTKFTIDFFEYSFLLEACIPPVPIARSMFWLDSINTEFYRMNTSERNSLHEWISRNGYFQKGLQDGNKDIIHWDARYNPKNQYRVTTDFNGDIKEHLAYKLDNKYYIRTNTSLMEEYITKIEQVYE